MSGKMHSSCVGARIHIFDNDTSGDFRSNLIDGAIPMWAV